MTNKSLSFEHSFYKGEPVFGGLGVGLGYSLGYNLRESGKRKFKTELRYGFLVLKGAVCICVSLPSDELPRWEQMVVVMWSVAVGFSRHGVYMRRV